MIQASPTSQLVRCDSDPKIHVVVSLVTKVHPVMQVLCTRMIRCRKGTQRRPQAQLAPLVKHSNPPPPRLNSYDC